MDNQPPKDSPFWKFIDDARDYMRDHSVEFIKTQTKYLVDSAKKMGFIVQFRFNPEIDPEYLICGEEYICDHGCAHVAIALDTVVDYNRDSFAFTVEHEGAVRGFAIPYRALLDYSILNMVDNTGLVFPAGIPVYFPALKGDLKVPPPPPAPSMLH